MNLKVVEVDGKITQSFGGGLKLIPSLCSVSGSLDMNRLYKLYSFRWDSVKFDFKQWSSVRDKYFKLGDIKISAFQTDSWAIHWLCFDDKNKLNEKALKECINKTIKIAKEHNASFHVNDDILDAAPPLRAGLSDFIDSNVRVYSYIE